MVSSNLAESPEKTMELLWAQVRQRGDLPGFSKVVGAIIGAMNGDDDREFSMTKTVLQDPALTQKVLRLANSAMYSVFGQGINTVSKAVIVLGTDAIGHLALGQKLIDGLSSAAGKSDEARAEMEKAVLAGHIARQVASAASCRDAEEAVVCSMLHSLGRMLVAFYLPQQWAHIRQLIDEGVDEKLASQRVLAMGLDEIGRLAGQRWGLPPELVNTLQDVTPRPPGEPLDHQDWLAAVSTLSARCAEVLRENEGQAQAQTVELAQDYAKMLGLEAEDVAAAVRTAQVVAAEEEAPALRVPMRESDAETILQVTMMPGKPQDAALILARGVADMRGESANTSAMQLLTVGLETVFQGLGFTRAIAFLHDPQSRQFAAQMSFGNVVQDRWDALRFADAYQPDVFHAAIANDKMIFVENAREPSFAPKLPRWWRDNFTTTRSFMVLPLTVNRAPAGFIYGDWDLDAPAAHIEQVEVGPLNELRTLIMRALESQRMIGAQQIRSR